MNLRRLYTPFLFLLSLTALNAQEKKDPIVIKYARELSYDKPRLGDVKRLVGNVAFEQRDMRMFCDSAYADQENNRFTAFGNVRILQGDSLEITGDKLLYEGDTKYAVLTGKRVTLSDSKFNLVTTALQYNAESRTGYYTNGATITSGENTLKSNTGTYFATPRIFGFRNKVELVNPKYLMKCDTLQYHQHTGVAYFYGPTYIFAENKTDIYCENGWFDTRNNSSSFSRNSYVKTPTQFLTADSMTYNGRENIDRAFGRIRLKDSINKVEIFGEKGVNFRSLNTAKITEHPLASLCSREGDTLYIDSDTLTTVFDTVRQNRKMFANYHVKMFGKDFSGKCDSLYYSQKDSLIKMENKPIVWNKQSQVTSDTIYLYLSNNQADRMLLKKNVFIISKDTTDKFNQIKGRDAEAFFTDNEIRTVHINGDGQSVYYIKEDSATYTGVNKIVCSKMKISIFNNEINEVRFYAEPSGTMYPLDKAPAEEIKLKGFAWRISEQPEWKFEPLINRNVLR